MITTPVVKDYLINYARTLIYTTSLSPSVIIQTDCSFDVLESGKAQKVRRRFIRKNGPIHVINTAPRIQLSNDLLSLSEHFVTLLRTRLHLLQIPPDLLSLPSHLQKPPLLHAPIIPLMTSSPRPLSTHLQSLGLNVRPIVWPTVPKGKERVRICLHARNTREEVELLAKGALDWALSAVASGKQQEQQLRNGALVEAKL
jgi:8-amino-7-oxononanoate synthase